MFKKKRKNARLVTFNNKGARMLDFFYHITLKLLRSRGEGENQESIQSSTTGDPGYRTTK